MRPLNYTQADACENARFSRCKCRCGGALHGAKRGIPFDELGIDDPHHTDAEPANPRAREIITRLKEALTDGKDRAAS
jgi:hypothetical protein